MTIGILYDLKTDYTSSSDTVFIDFEPFETFSRIKHILERAGYDVALIGKKGGDICKQISLIRQCDIVFNFCEGFNSRNREALMPALLEKLGVKYIGSDATACALTTNKILTKVVAAHLGIRTPKWFEVRNCTVNKYDESQLCFPRVIKPNAEGNSGGIFIVKDTEEQNIVLKRIAKNYGEILIEEYIEGRELTVPVVGSGSEAKALAVVETLDASGKALDFYNVDMKFGASVLKVEAVLSPQIKEKIAADALTIYNYLGCLDFGRIDFRLSSDGIPYLLELNLLPSLELNSSFYYTAKILNVDFSEIILSILKTATKRLGVTLIGGSNG